MKDITVLVLAGGDSQRFWPLEDKHSLLFLGKPLPYFTFLKLKKYGVRNIVIVVNKKNKDLFEKLKKEFREISINLIQQTDPRGMAGAVLSAKKYIAGKKLLIISTSDMWEEIILDAFGRVLKSNPEGVIAGVSSDTYFPGGYLKVSDGEVRAIIEKPKPEKLPSKIVTIVFDYFKDGSKLVEAIDKIESRNDDLFEKAIEFLLGQNFTFKFLPYKGFWGYVKFPWHVLNISSYILSKTKNQIKDSTSIDKSAKIIGPVLIEQGVRILENTKIIGPAYIGRGTLVGNNSVIRESMIGANCVIGYSTEIARSYVGDNCWFHSNYIGDSVISNNVSMGAGSVLANFRLDESIVCSFINKEKIETGKNKLGAMIGQNVRIGVNSSIMPGIKIGRDCFVGAGVILKEDLSDGKYCELTEIKYKIQKNKIKVPYDFRDKLQKKLKV